jgi:protein SCO1/2
MVHRYRAGKRRTPPALWLLGALLLVSSALLAGCGSTASTAPNDANAVFDLPTEGTPIEPPLELTDVTLTSHEGTPLSLSDLQGGPVLLYFGYTFCPDICPTTLAEMVQVRRELGEQADEVAFVFVSVDPERDTPEVLQRHLSAFDEAFIGLSGDEVTLSKISGEYGLFYEKRSVEGTSAKYLIDHTTKSYLIGSDGKLHMIYSYGMPADVIAADIRAMLEEG